MYYVSVCVYELRLVNKTSYIITVGLSFGVDGKNNLFWVKFSLAKYLPNAIFWLFYFISLIFWAKMIMDFFEKSQ